jgi:hypothetical protein
MTDEERAEVNRASFELESQFGQNADKFAAKKAEGALADGNAEQAQFWKWVEASLKPQGRVSRFEHDGMSYFLEVSIARRFKEDLSHRLGEDAFCKRLIEYAINDV